MSWKTLNSPLPWVEELTLCLQSTPQFVLDGNIHDLCFLPGSESLVKHASVSAGLVRLLRSQGYEYVLTWDQVNGLFVPQGGAEEEALDHCRSLLGLSELGEQQGTNATDVADLITVARQLVNDERRGALLISYASRLVAADPQPNIVRRDAQDVRCLLYTSPSPRDS